MEVFSESVTSVGKETITFSPNASSSVSVTVALAVIWCVPPSVASTVWFAARQFMGSAVISVAKVSKAANFFFIDSILRLFKFDV